GDESAPRTVLCVARVDVQGTPQPRELVLGRRESRREYTDDRHRPTVERDGAPDHVARAAEALLPQLVREHHDAALVADEVRALDEAAQLRARAEGAEQLRRRDAGWDALRAARRRQVHAPGPSDADR